MSDETNFNSGVFRIQADSPEEFERKRSELAELVGKTAEEQRERLNNAGKGAWWADAVFLVHDIKGVCRTLSMRDEDDIAEVLAEIAGKSTMALLLQVFDGDTEKATAVAREIMAEGEVLNAVIDKLLNGSGDNLQ